jgi:tetratricopeptide (TPR) repeat protein
LSAFRSILHERPDFDAARTSAATVLMAGNQNAEAVELLREGLEHRQSPELLATLGTALRAAGHPAAAADAFRRARAAGDQNPDLLNQLAVLSAEMRQPDEARALFQELLAQDPAAATSWFNLGLFELQSPRLPDAVAAFRRAVALDPSYGDAWNALGSALLATDKAGAVDAWRHAERLVPGDYDLLFNLAVVLSESSDPSEAVPYLRRFVQEAPPARYGRDIAQVRAILQRVERGAR